jgi:predicted glycosyltransferase involved in capsule biosynthesis
MNSISLNMKFWNDGQPDSTRIRNVNFSWEELKKLTSYLNDNGIYAVASLYDFSPEQIIRDSTHISYPLGVYKKSEKTNIILKDKKDYDFFMMIDCDAFFHEQDYEKLLKLIKSLNRGDVCTFDLSKLKNNISEYIINGRFVIENADWSYAYSGPKENGPLRNHIGGLGGVYISDTQLLISLGGFDEKYVGWGAEDGDMLDRIYRSEIIHKIKPTNNFAPFHLPHFSDWGNVNYSQRFTEDI